MYTAEPRQFTTEHIYFVGAVANLGRSPWRMPTSTRPSRKTTNPSGGTCLDTTLCEIGNPFPYSLGVRGFGKGKRDQ